MEKNSLYRSYNVNKYDIEIKNDLMECRVFWARVISSESESLFTQNTKHTFYEIQYALEGRIGMSIGDGERISFDESDFIVIPPDTYHQIVDGDTEGARFIMAFTLQSTSPALSRAIRGLHSLLPHRETPHMRELLSLMLQKNYSDTPLRKKQINILIEGFLMEILEALSESDRGLDPTESRSTSAKRTVSDIQAFIHSYGGIGIGVCDLARHFNLSERHLSRLFVSVTGKSPKEAINHEKLGRIETLVSTTSLTLGEISELCGFSDEYAMNKFFKRYTLTSLSEFRAISRQKKDKKQ